MGKKDEYRFNLRFDERNVPDCGLNKCTTELGMQIRIKEV